MTLNQWESWVQKCLSEVEEALDRFVPAQAPAGLGDAMRYAVLGGGKRLRPVLVLAACEAVQGHREAALRAAVAVELIHASGVVLVRRAERIGNQLHVAPRRQVEARVIVPKIGRALNERGPRAHPPPECIASMPLEVPILRATAVMREVHGKHLATGHDAQEFCLSAKLHHIVWSGSGRRTQAERRILERLNHPSAVWVRKNVEHYRWLFDLTYWLIYEYKYRYDGKYHKCEALLPTLMDGPNNIPITDWEDPPQAMPDDVKVINESVEAYRNYYRNHKRRMANWKVRGTPDWYK